MARCRATTAKLANREAVASGVSTSTEVLDTSIAGSQEWRLCNSRSEETYSEDESGGSSIGNEERGAASDWDHADDEKGE